ncbi:hypothetical protein NUM3379_37100 [Kineococcus sp. NUM-3379]
MPAIHAAQAAGIARHRAGTGASFVAEQDRRVLATLTADDREFLLATLGAAVGEGSPVPTLAVVIAADRQAGVLPAGAPVGADYLHHLIEEWRYPLTPREFGNALRWVTRPDPTA